MLGLRCRRLPLFAVRNAGDVIWHAPNAIHAMMTDAHPLLAVWSWTRDTHTPARLVEA